MSSNGQGNKSIRVFLVGEDQIANEAIVQQLNLRGRIAVVGTAPRLRAARRHIDDASTDILLIGANGLESEYHQIVRHIRENRSEVRVIIMGLERDSKRVLGYLEHGVRGYVFKDETFEDLCAKIEAVYQGRFPASPEVLADVFRQISHLSRLLGSEDGESEPALTPREKQILELIAIGLSNKEIAQKLEISLYTVKNHVHNLLEKLQVRRRAEAVRYGFKKGLLRSGFRSAWSTVER